MPNTYENVDTTVMSDADLDQMLEDTYTEPEGEYYEEDGDSNTDSVDTDVRPLDDIDEQPEDDDSDPDVDLDDDLDEDPEDVSSTDDNDQEDGEDDGTEDGDEPDDSNPDADLDEGKDSDSERQQFQPLRADGKEYPIESMEELYQMAAKAIGADNRFRDSAAGRKTAATMKKNNLTDADINLLVELKSGNKDAILSLLAKNEIDPLDIDADAFNENYRPEDHSADDFSLKLDEVVARVKTQPRYDESVKVIMETWDDKSREAFYENPNILELLNVDMQSVDGQPSMYDKVMPLATKLKVLGNGNKTDLDYYMEAGSRVLAMEQQKQNAGVETKKLEAKAKLAKQKKIRQKKKAASATGSQSGANNNGNKTVEDMTDDELDAVING